MADTKTDAMLQIFVKLFVSLENLPPKKADKEKHCPKEFKKEDPQKRC